MNELLVVSNQGYTNVVPLWPKTLKQLKAVLTKFYMLQDPNAGLHFSKSK